MSNGPNNFTDEEKAAIALKAASGDAELQELSKEHGISVDEIKDWMRETGVSRVSEDESEISIEVTDDYAKAVEYGATFDTPNYKRIVFWSAFGSAVILLIILSVFYVHNYTTSTALTQASQGSQFYNIEQMKEDDRETLNTFGVVDPEEGIYRIPIDRAISEIVNERN